jgi:hypothetical protein
VAASGQWVDEDGTRLPAGEVHAWEQGTNATLCGLPLHRSSLQRFAGVRWKDVQPESGGSADEVRRVCPRCQAATRPRSERSGRSWERRDPRP